MSTYRERREARAARLREWAEKREEKAEQSYKAGRDALDIIPFGQPILIGHYSEKRDRNYRAKAVGKIDKSFEHQQKADKMNQWADTIEGQLDRSIYSDDPDAIERLEERIAELEAKRESMKAANAEYRKAHKAELKEMTAYQKDQVLPFASFTITNLGQNINRNKKRLESLKRKAQS